MWSILLLIAYYLWPIAITLLVIKLYQWWKFPHPRFPPGPRGLPFIGWPPSFANRLQSKEFEGLTKKYGYVIGGKLMGINYVILNKFEDIHDAFTKQGSVMSDRPMMHLLNDISGGYGLLEKNYNTACKLHRKFGSSFFKGFFTSGMDIEKISANESHHFIQHLTKHAIGKPVDLTKIFYNITANVISSITLGRRFDYDDPTFRKIVKTSTEIFGDSTDRKLVFSCLVLNTLRHIPPFQYAYQRYISMHKEIVDFIQQEIDEHKKKFDPDNVNDFMDAFLKEQKFGPPKNQPYFNDAELRGFVKDLFLAGTETSSNTLSWAVAILLHHPEHMKRIQQEIDSVVGSNEQLTLSHRDSMPFSCAIIHEVMRYRTLIQLCVPHATSKEVDLREFHLPKSTMIRANLWAVHNDPALWEEPHIFNPLRFLDESGNFVASPHFIPFGIGLRRCLGERIAKKEIFFFLISLLQHFTLLPDPTAKKLPEIDTGSELLVYSPQKFKVVLRKRQPNRL
uniref:Cytochrome P450 2C42-like n=1 Tax=Phallusia mammillata TaxID=59560 RepID=A0A6F9DAY6_9ASCI|nr:cytochrome P450 2C42-like [Phallusia mammillata]